VVGEAGRVAMASTRRLQLAAEEGGVTGLMLKRWRRNGQDPIAIASSAMTRWRIGCVPSGELATEGIGRPRWRVELARQRGGEPFTLILEGIDATGSLALLAEPADRPAAPLSRAA
jgi:protein ImuA